TSRAARRSRTPDTSPAKPLLTPKTSQPRASAPRVTARTAAFIPGASPPLVRTAILFKPTILIDALLQPRAGRRGILDLPACSGLALAHLDRVPAGAIDDAEPVFVGQIVADEHRRALGERRLAQELLDRHALVASSGLDLDHHLARLHLDPVAQAGGGVAHHALRRLGERRREPVMQREARALVLEHQALVRGGEVAHRPRGALQAGKRIAAAVDAAMRVAAFDAMLSRCGDLERREQIVDRSKGTAAHQRECAACGFVELADQRFLAPAGLGRVGRLGDVEQRAVDVEEECPARRAGRHYWAAARRAPPATRASTRLWWRMRAASTSILPAQR